MEFCHSTIYGSISLLFLPLNFYPHPIIPPSFNLGLYVAPEGKFFSRMFSCKVLKKIEGKNIYYRIHLIRPLKRLWTRRGRPRTVTGHAFKIFSTAKSPLFPITSGHMHVIDGDEKIEKREKLKKKEKRWFVVGQILCDGRRSIDGTRPDISRIAPIYEKCRTAWVF